MHDKCSALFIFIFTCLVLTLLFITMAHDFKASSTMNVTEHLDLNGHINMNPMFKPKGSMLMKNSALEPVLFEKLHNIVITFSV